jgi:GNAT superfamily N-acetyltransferase
MTDRRFAEIRYLGAFFLDMLRGLPTLKIFGRGPEQVENIRAISRRYGETTMDVLRTAFQTSLVLEWGAAVAVALVAVEVSIRLMDGSIEFERALAVLIIVPEFFLPLRTLAIRYHAGADGRTVAERVFAVLDESGDLVGECTRSRDLEPEDELWFGFGLRPDLTGLGRGAEFVEACAKFAVESTKYPGEYIRLGVAAFNKRAVRCYEKIGFEEFRRKTGEWGEFKGLEIIHMRRKIARPSD